MARLRSRLQLLRGRIKGFINRLRLSFHLNTSDGHSGNEATVFLVKDDTDEEGIPICAFLGCWTCKEVYFFWPDLALRVMQPQQLRHYGLLVEDADGRDAEAA